MPLFVGEVVCDLVGHIKVLPHGLVFLPFGAHLEFDDAPDELFMGQEVLFLGLVGLLEVEAVPQVQSGSLAHDIHHNLHLPLLLQRIADVLERVHVGHDELRLRELEPQLALQEVFDAPEPVHQREPIRFEVELP
eukprot:CAMPEP_0170550822 /NCGR_PEP_ID=MMETSP0211-20121228/8844_1 /TAXON_ID=311385 /ORGANISM="Pseudokeronopsis sp., Strain OXSARD2" /LENGTH=134 /DNA_ID=CAMNT_0010857593 /DNA_START=535 /DNA_END=935 /DNA_ORIENTATION=-